MGFDPKRYALASLQIGRNSDTLNDRGFPRACPCTEWRQAWCAAREDGRGNKGQVLTAAEINVPRRIRNAGVVPTTFNEFGKHSS